MARRQDLDRTPHSPGRGLRDPTTHYEDATGPRSPDAAAEGRVRPELLSIHTSDAMLRSPDGHQRWDGNNGSGPSAHPHPDAHSHPHAPPEARMESTAASSATDAIVAQLHLIQSLQSEITAEHSALENLGGGNGDSNGHSKSQSSGTGPSAALGRSNATTTSSGLGSESGGAGNAAASAQGHSDDADSKEDKRASADAYDTLSAGFRDRQRGVESMMDKLSQLSKAVKEFHALPAPVLFPDSRMLNSGQIVDTPVQMSARGRFPS